MPRNRSEVTRDAKIEEIVEAARLRLVEGGYGALSVAALARDLGLAQGAIYWYFPTKDHLFVAAVERILHDILSRKPRRGSALDEVVWFAERLHEVQDLRMAMRDRARFSEVVAKFEQDISDLLAFMLTNALAGSIGEDDIGDVVDCVMALCEGVLLRDVGQRRRRHLIAFGYTRIVGSG